MKWEEVRRFYPDQFVKLRILGSRREGNREYVHDVAVVRNITDPAEATNELMKCRGDMLVYHTSNEKVVLEVRTRPGIRGTI
ncbi:MAG: hypothetical protein K9L17_13060 [Clostridiales bacterium]|nr:hypothetical protein [Clostridiales bacterium]MCF8023608.1 hypothetical protein [Clostridiales bacterium]